MLAIDMRSTQRLVEADDGDRELVALPAQRTCIHPKFRSEQHSVDISTVPTDAESVYPTLNLCSRQIRLFQLYPRSKAADIQGSFHCVSLEAPPAYTALSYTWGDAIHPRRITVDSNTTIDVRKNLWEFLHQQSSIISEPKLFWIDAICIDQSDIHERNHQVNLMKQIYIQACDVYIWLGVEDDNSNLAVDYILKKGRQRLRRRGSGYHAFWAREEGKALHELCERSYWRRMWM